MSTILARVYLVRHGETDENRNGIIQGQLDTSLNSLGLEQARLVGNALRSIPIDIAYSSDLSRATNVRSKDLYLVRNNQDSRRPRQSLHTTQVSQHTTSKSNCESGYAWPLLIGSHPGS